MIIALLEITAILFLVAMNGTLAAAEMAVVSARRSRLRRRAQEGDAGAERVVQLLRSPNRFLSTVQIGITAVAVAGGAFGGVRLAGYLTDQFVGLGVSPELARTLSLPLVVVLITYLMLVLGELVPKRLALRHPEDISSRLSGSMHGLSKLAAPLVRILSFSTDLVLRLLPLSASDSGNDVTEEEIKLLVADATEAGVLERTEQDIVAQLFHLSDQAVERIMTPRKRIVWLDINHGPERWRDRMGEVVHTRYIVADGDLDRYLGYVKVQDLFRRCSHGSPLELEPFLREPHLVSRETPAFRILELFQWSGEHLALVTDDRGDVLGIVTLHDVMEGIVGDIPEPREVAVPKMVPREDGSWLVDGLFPFEDFLEAFDMVPQTPPRYENLHAFVTDRLDGSPRESLTFYWRDFTIEVVDMDGRRVDKVLVSPDASA